MIFSLFLASFFLIYIHCVGVFGRQKEGYVYMVSEQALWGAVDYECNFHHLFCE